MIEITIPAIGVAMTEATVLEWLKQPGDAVAADEAVLEIETDKAMTELTSAIAGRLGRRLVAAGETIPVGTVVARVLEGDETEPDDDPATGVPAAAAEAPAAAAQPAAGARADRAAGSRRLSPRERRLAAAQAVAGDDAVDRAGAPAGAPAPDRFRELIAAKTLEAWQTIPHFAVTRQLDATPLRAALEAARAAHDGAPETRPTLTDLMLRALGRALSAIGGGGDVALAVATPRGVANPLIRDAGALPLAALAAARAGAVGRARAGRLGEADVGVATTTLSNLGTEMVDTFTGIITPGQRTLLTVGAIALRPWVADGEPTARETFSVTVNADHRALDGADAAALLTAFADAVADPALAQEGEAA